MSLGCATRTLFNESLLQFRVLFGIYKILGPHVLWTACRVSRRGQANSRGQLPAFGAVGLTWPTMQKGRMTKFPFCNVPVHKWLLSSFTLLTRPNCPTCFASRINTPHGRLPLHARVLLFGAHSMLRRFALRAETYCRPRRHSDAFEACLALSFFSWYIHFNFYAPLASSVRIYFS